jgi:glycosyltransferase involved in cell wall biosynthesis
VNLDEITPLIITWDEATNIRRTLDKLIWAKQIIVVDSGSTDGTIEILQTYGQVGILHRLFTDFADQCNFGVTHVKTPWVLSLDADYELSDSLVTELKSLEPSGTTAGYAARFIYRIYGRPLRASLYPSRTVLYRRVTAKYQNEGHGHRVVVDGLISSLSAPIYHDDRKPLARWFASQQRYAQKEAEYLLSSNRADLGKMDRIRLAAWPAPLLVLVYTLLIKRCALDGWPGWAYALQRTLAETLIALELIDRRLAGSR